MACALFLVLGWCFWLPALQSRSAVPVRDKGIDRLLRKSQAPFQAYQRQFRRISWTMAVMASRTHPTRTYSLY